MSRRLPTFRLSLLALVLFGAGGLCAASPARPAAANPTQPIDLAGPPAPPAVATGADALTVADVLVPGASGADPEARPLAPVVPAPNAAESRAPASDGSARIPAASTTRPGAGSWLPRTLLALACVVALIFLTRFVLARCARGAIGLAAQLGPAGRAPSGVLSVLARYPVARGQTLVLLCVDRRVLLLCQTSAGFTPLSEITDPEEVAAIMVKAQDEEGATLSRRFRSLLSRLERDPALAPAVVESGPTTPRLALARIRPDAAPDESAAARDETDAARAVVCGAAASHADDPRSPPEPLLSLRARLHSLREMSA